MVAEDDDQNRIGFHLEEIVVSYITNQWVKMNPFEAAARIIELERENTALRSALTTLLAWEDKGGDIPPTAARGLFRIARAALDAARKEAQP
jgi:hypothetical protein